MRNYLWILLSLGFFLLAKGLPHPSEKDDLGDLEIQFDEAERDGDDEDEGPAPILHSKSQQFIFDVGETVRLPCKVENDEAAVVIWWMDKSILWTGKVAGQGLVGHSNFKLDEDHSMIINGLKSEDSAAYNCSVLHGDNLQSIVYDVNIAGKPTIIRTVPESDKKIDKGTPLTLMCEAAGYPPPSISWTKKTRHGEEKLEGSKIAIDSATRKHSGVYECKATNSKGEDLKKIEIHVQYEPEVEVDEGIVYSGEGYESELVCTVHGEPKPKVSWLKDDNSLSLTHHHITLSDKGSKHFLRISGTTKNDFGVYRCNAQNVKGINSKTITLTGTPSKPKFHAAELSSDNKSPILSWSIDSYAPIREYELLYKLQDKVEWTPVEVAVEGPTPPEGNRFIARHTLSGLGPGVYQAQLRAKNNFGWSETSEPHSFSGNLVDSSDILNNAHEASETGLLESAQNDDPNVASELRISFAFVMSLLLARYYF